MRKLRIERTLGVLLFILTFVMLAVIYKQIVAFEETPKATISPRFPMDVTVTQPEFDNGEETTIHIIEKDSDGS